jgi:hypothetical protein
MHLLVYLPWSTPLNSMFLLIDSSAFGSMSFATKDLIFSISFRKRTDLSPVPDRASRTVIPSKGLPLVALSSLRMLIYCLITAILVSLLNS